MLKEMESFRKVLEGYGFDINGCLIPNGKIHRIHVKGDKVGTKNGWYVIYTEGLPAGAFGCWKRSIYETWCIKTDSEQTTAQRQQNRRRIIEAHNARKSEEQNRRSAARDRAAVIWTAASSDMHDHPYLTRKAVSNYGLRLYKGALVLPLRDSVGILHSLQFIDCDGNKRFLSGGRKSGCYFPIGSPEGSICIAEGYATAASIYEATGLPVAVAFDAGNLEPVAIALRAKFPETKIIICADNDADTFGNPGLTRAKKAAVACGGLLAVPPIVGDFNDFLRNQL